MIQKKRLPPLALILLCLVLKSRALSAPSGLSFDFKHALYDMPVSNNGARCRIILYKKGIPDAEVSIQPPMQVGGLNSEEYLTMNPQGKMPTLHCVETGFNIPESDTIARYLLNLYADSGPSFQPDNCKSNLLCRFHDVYLSPIQGCMYKATPPFGTFGTRKDALKEFCKQLQIMNDMLTESDFFLCGSEVSLADAAIFPTLVFAKHMLPKFQGYDAHSIPRRIDAWFERLKENDSAFRKVYDEIQGGLERWEQRNRWDSIWLAGVRDDAPATVFDKIIAGEIPADVVKEDEKILAFKDINPSAPAHVLVIPKDRAGLTNIRKATPEHIEILGRLMVAAGEIANEASLGFGDGARLVINDGLDGGQEVMHLHVHVLGGRQMSWPPG